MMRKSIVFLALVALTGALSAAERPYVVKADGSRVFVDQITRGSSQGIEFKDGKFTRKMRSRDYKYAWVPRPDEAKKAGNLLRQGKYDEAVAAFKDAFNKYRYLGWDVYCVYGMGTALSKAGKTKEAIKTLESLKGYKLLNRDKQDELNRALMLLSELLIQDNQLDDANDVLKHLVQSSNNSVSAFALNRQGEILKKQGKSKDATLKYLETVLMFPEELKQERAEAMYNVVVLLREQNDARAKTWADQLKQKYPQSPYVSKLK